MGQTIRKRVIYHGLVQGVGFRATTHSIASRFNATGYVRNRADGTVELVVDGPTSDVNAFLAAVASHFSRNVTNVETETLHGGELLSSFTVRH